MREKRQPPSAYFAAKPLACNNCRKSKLRCSRVKPCDSCVARGTEDACYQDKRPSISSKENGVASTSSLTLEVLPAALDSTLIEVITALRSQGQSLFSLANTINEASTFNKKTSSNWQDEVRQSLPAAETCDILSTFYYDELYIFGSIMDRSTLRDVLSRIQRNSIVLAAEASILLLILSTAAINFPALHPARRLLTCDTSAQHPIWLSLADTISAKGRINILKSKGNNPSSEILLDVAVAMGFAMYFNSAGRNDEMWDCLGTAIRKSSSIAIFDDRSPQWRRLTHDQKRQRRTLGLGIALMDAWASFNRMRTPGIHPSLVHLHYENFNSRTKEESYTGIMDPRQLFIVHRSREYMMAFDSMVPSLRYSQATSLVSEIQRISSLILQDVEKSEVALSPSSNDRAGTKSIQRLICTSTPAYLACVITRRFLTDEGAPDNLRFRSLSHAQEILSHIPTLIAIIEEQKLPLNPSWNANQLLCAASAYSVILLGQDHYMNISSTSAYKSSYNEGEGEATSLDDGPYSATLMLMHPQIRMHFEWLSSCIFDILDCLDMIQRSTGNRMAVLCKQILEGLCRLDAGLATALKQRRAAAQSPKASSVHSDEALQLLDLVFWPSANGQDDNMIQETIKQQMLASFS